MENTIVCPDCGKPMKIKTARKGKFAGQQFYGCSGYPSCKKIVNLSDISDVGSPIETRKRNSATPQIEIPDTSEDNRFKAPIPIHASAISPTNQVKFFQAVGTTEKIVEISHDNSNKIKRDNQLAFSQWRLDYPLPRKKAVQKINRILPLVEKILNRGSISICTPRLEEFLLSHTPNRNNDVEYWIETLRNISKYPRNTFVALKLESNEEIKFYQKEILNRGLCKWTIPQLSASSIANGYIDSESEQRVDFFIFHPNFQPCVIELDGVQHEMTTNADRARDIALTNSGVKVIRIPVKELSSASGLNYRSAIKYLESLSKSNFDESIDADQHALLLTKMGSQIQLAVLEAFRSGHLSLSKSSKFRISIIPPEWLEDHSQFELMLEAMLQDLGELFNSIFELILGEKSKIEFLVSPTQSADIMVDFGNDDTHKPSIKIPVFSISDIAVPIEILQSYSNAKPQNVINPKKSIVKRLLYFLFRKSKFMDGQWEAIKRLLQGEDSILLLPTGGGKTIAFQLAAMLRPGTCLVVDPIIALIEDQVGNLKRYGIDRALGISSNLNSQERLAALETFGKGHYLFCYIAPERLQMQDFRSSLRALTVRMPVAAIVIDEAHCISEWGHDFRVAYLNIARNSREYCSIDGSISPLIGLTGTASRSVLRDIQRELEITDFEAVITPKSFDRPELNFSVIFCKSNEKSERLSGWLTALPDIFGESGNTFFIPRGESSNAGIIFYPHVNGIHGVVEGYEFLQRLIGNNIGIYSGKSPKGFDAINWPAAKSSFASRFRNNKLTVLASTKAFGMGIDKQNIRYTVHTNLPQSIESFYQEAGRAGRDRQSSHCAVIISNDYPNRTRKLLNPTTSLKEVAKEIEGIGWEDADDISRALFFHVNAFKGISSEVREVRQLLEDIGQIGIEKRMEIAFSDGDRVPIEKAVHRLVVIGVIDDYTIDYAREQFLITTSGNMPEENLQSYKKYIANYDLKIADKAESNSRMKMELPHQEFALYLAKNLITEFIYQVVEQSRRRSLSEMLQAATQNQSDESLRKRMLDYLSLGQYSEILDEIQNKPELISQAWTLLITEIQSPNDAAEMRGQVSRLLESYPTNPALLFARAVSEAYSVDLSEEIIYENFMAFVEFSLSESSWGLSIKDVIRPITSFLNHLCERNIDFAQSVYVGLVDQIGPSPVIHRALLRQTNMAISVYSANLLLGELKSSIDMILK